MVLEDHIAGSEKRYKGGTFYLVERTLEDVGAGTIADYIRGNRINLESGSIQRQFPELAHIPKRKMLFLDIENCGLDINSPIISIALAHLNSEQDISFECMFARNFAEERTLLGYFLDRLKAYQAFFTYNGKSFDVPRIRARAIHNGLYESSLMTSGGLLSHLEIENAGGTPDTLGNVNNHHDLYHLCKSRVHLADARLKTFEKTLPQFGHFRRKGDLASAEIPKFYFEYVYGRRRMTRKVIADMDLWKKCLKQAKEHAPPSRESDKEKQELMIKSFAQGLYKGMFHDLPPGYEEVDGVCGGYRDEYYPGEKIDETERKSDMARLINHNLLDTVTLVGILCYLCSPQVKNTTLPLREDDLPF